MVCCWWWLVVAAAAVATAAMLLWERQSRVVNREERDARLWVCRMVFVASYVCTSTTNELFIVEWQQRSKWIYFFMRVARAPPNNG